MELKEVKKIVVHCSDSEFGSKARLKRWHLQKGWSDIGYHFVINNGYEYKGDEKNSKIQDGFIEVGRDLKTAGAHVKGFNSSTLGVCLIGRRSFSEAQLRALKVLLNGLLEEFGLSTSDILGHYELDSKKSCPNLDMDVIRGLEKDTNGKFKV